MTVVMPPNANIPYEYQIGSDNGRLVIVVPSWSRHDKSSYAVFMDKNTRVLTCECKGFEFNGDCHHVRGIAWLCGGPRTRKRGVAPLSVEAFRTIQEDLPLKRREVLDTLRRIRSASNKQLSDIMNWPINCITPRVKELRDMGLVDFDHEQVDPNTNRSEAVWRPVC
jgi:hypothetical protein